MLLRERAEDILSLVDKTEAEFKSLEEINSGDIYIGAPGGDESLRRYSMQTSKGPSQNPM